MSASKSIKLSKKEREEPVTKGYLTDYLEDKLENYVTKDYLDEKLENYVTKDYLDKKIDQDLVRHIGAMLEDSNSKLQILFEHFDARTEELRKMYLNHENRISHLELNTKKA
jgi:hypothetical protein